MPRLPDGIDSKRCRILSIQACATTSTLSLIQTLEALESVRFAILSDILLMKAQMFVSYLMQMIIVLSAWLL